MFRIILTCLIFLGSLMVANAQNEMRLSPEKLAQAQLEAYNKRDLEEFVKHYAEEVKVFTFPNSLLYEGREEMKNIYGRMFSRTPDLHCKLINRIVMGNTVIDHEEVTRKKGEEPMRAIAIYKITDHKISEVYFIYEK